MSKSPPSRFLSLLPAMLLGLAILVPVSASFAAELVMFDRQGCPWCARWEAEVGPVYPKTPEGQKAPLRRVSLDNPVPADLKFDPPIRYTPTFVLMHEGREIGRIVGYMGDDAFWGLLGTIVRRLPAIETR